MWTDLKRYFQMLVMGLAKNEEGQALVEYALILALVSVVAIVVLQAIGTGVVGTLGSVAKSL
jgi:pilus assembly protein Flp/PilA